MPPEIRKIVINFENSRQAVAVLPPASATAEEILQALDIKDYRAVLLIIGGADNLDEKQKSQLIQLFGRGIARAALNANAVIIDGATESGVMAIMGQGVADRGYKSSLIGVAPLELIKYPGSSGPGEIPLDSNHSHFVLVDGSAWGSETSTIYKLVSELRSKAPTVALIAGGGAVSRTEALRAVRQNLPLLVIEGSGALADEIATAWKARPVLPEDPLMAEIIADGRVELHSLNNSVRAAERLIIRELGGDNVLRQAWERFADYDLNAKLQQRRFNKLQLAILAIGVLATALALAKQVFAPKDPATGNFVSSWKGWWVFPSSVPDRKLYPWFGWWLLQYLLISLPILLTVLLTAASKFKQGNKWLLLRAGAEAIKREIFRFRTRSGDYKEVFNLPPTQPADPAAPPPLPPSTPEQVLAQRVEDVTRRAMRTEVNTSSLIPYQGKVFPPYMDAAQGGDDGLSMLTPDRYVQVRLGDQLGYYKSKAILHEQRLKWIQWSIFIVGGLGTLLAAINQQVWIALTTAVAAGLASFLSYQQTENTLMKYNQAATDLDNVKQWWTALPADEQAKQTNVDALVEHTEKVLQSELDGWMQQMQDALAQLRKGQAQAPENEEPPSGNGPEKPQTPEEKAPAAKAAPAQTTAAKDAEKTPGKNGGAANLEGDKSVAANAGGDKAVDADAGTEKASATNVGGDTADKTGDDKTVGGAGDDTSVEDVAGDKNAGS